MKEIVRQCVSTTGFRQCALKWFAGAVMIVGCIAVAPVYAQQVSVSVSHVLTLDSAGKAYAWGADRRGQLGVGRSILENSPVAALGLTGVTSISAAGAHVLALRSDGTVWAWGENQSGQLGDGTNSLRSIPQRVAGLPRIAAIGTGAHSSYAITEDGALWGWGRQAGPNTPVLVPMPRKVTQVVGGGAHTMMLLDDGTVRAEGSNSSGQLGTGTPIVDSPHFPSAAVQGVSNVIQLAALNNNSLALTRAGEVYVWGRDFAREAVSRRAEPPISVPTKVAGLPAIVSIAVGAAHALALASDGRVFAWGDNSAGQLGDGTTNGSATPVVSRVTLPAQQAGGQVRAAAASSYVLSSDAQCFGWGSNAFGQLSGTVGAHVLPFRIEWGSAMRQLATGDAWVVGLTAGATVLGMGNNQSGPLGNGVALSSSVPLRVDTGEAFKSLAAAANFSLGLSIDGSVWAWGTNGLGELGGNFPVGHARPGRNSLIGRYLAIAAAGLVGFALRDDGTVWSWGSSIAFRTSLLGDGRTGNGLPPQQIPTLRNITQISARGGNALALRSDGTVWSWGMVDFQATGLPIGQARNPALPAQVAGLPPIAAVTAGEAHSLVLARDGTVWSWGLNAGGQLGNGSSVDSQVPVQLKNLGAVAKLGASYGTSAAVTVSGDLYAWGNLLGIAYDGKTGDWQQLPRRLPAPRNLVDLSVGDQIVVLDAQGVVYSAGSNQNGILGDGSFVSRGHFVTVRNVGGAGSLSKSDWYLNLGGATSAPLDYALAPAFLATTTANGTAVAANVTYREQDLGSTQSTYVFALAPANIVKGAEAKGGASSDDPAARITLKSVPATDDPVAQKQGPLGCVLAQLNSQGQLTAVAASNLQAYVSGVLSAGGTAVNVLNNISAAAIQGSTFFIGYGTSGTSMINNGVNRSVTSIPGSQNCQPQAPQTGWWWNPAEGGRGFSVEVRGNNLFWAGFLYDTTGRASWLVSPGPTALDGSLFQATLYSVANGQTLTGAYKPNSPPVNEGTVTMSFSSATTGTLIWPGGTIPIERLNFVPNGLSTPPAPNQPENGWWWNPQESGRGFFIEWQNGVVNATGYMYDDTGKPVWYLGVYPVPDPRVVNGSWWQYANGQTLLGPYKPATRVTDNFAPLAIRFTDKENAVMTLPNGRLLNLTRHRF